MSKRTTESIVKSSPERGELEDWLRGNMQKLIQEVLEEEVTEFLGRAKSERRSEADSDLGYRSGHGRARKLTLSSGTIELSRPRVRNTDEKFESRLLPLFAKRTAKVAQLIPQLYLHGLSEGAFGLALRGPTLAPEVLTCAEVERLDDGAPVLVAGWPVARQHPKGRDGTIFVTIEDETGDSQVILWPHIYKRYRRELGSQVVLIAGEISRWDGTSNTIVSEVRALRSGVRMPEAHNWH